MNYHLEIDGEIGPWGYSKGYVKNKLREYKGKEVAVRINSLGGSLDHGIAMASYFKDHGQVTAYIVGFTASAATVAAMGAKKTVMEENALYLIHKVSNWVSVWGTLNADEMQAEIERLQRNKQENDKIDLVIGRMYAKKSGKQMSDIMTILKRGGWLTAQEAFDYGFVDEIISDKSEKVNVTAQLADKFNAYGLPTLPAIASADKQNSSILGKLQEIVAMLSPKEKKNEDEQQTVIKTKTKINVEMKKDYTKVNAILGVEGVTLTDGKANFTDEQLGKINAELERLATEAADAKEQLQNLQASAGDDTGEKREEGEGESMADRLNASYELLKNLV